ncbi:MucR family transcriptional regulator [Modestobacter italicus]|uniref:MucR family transcriptional regulator n=1 Tax=Modestobacter italicus (strain DSM 44449 / CECT 9708 / BC 501) TaxID=2732864 RepID=UPI001C94E35F|nr:MucR family transcriptional regulator [Modestobacter italicus]
MLHPVGPLPASVYWRRRLLALGCALGVLGGGGWVAVAAATGDAETSTDAAGEPGAEPTPIPGLEQVVPALAAVQVPTIPPTTAPEPTAPEPSAEVPAPPAQVAGGPCGDDMIAVEVRPDPASAPVGSKPTFDLVVTNTSPVPCVRDLDKALQEIVLLDAASNRVWGSNDCFPETTTDQRTLQPGEAAAFPVLWGGLTSSPGCAGDRVPPPPGDYVLRARLDTKTSADAAFTLT